MQIDSAIGEGSLTKRGSNRNGVSGRQLSWLRTGIQLDGAMAKNPVRGWQMFIERSFLKS